MRPSRRNAASSDSGSPASQEQRKLGFIAPISIDYDEARTSEERSTFHQPRLAAQGEFLLDVHPVRRVKSLLRRVQSD